MTHQPRTKAKIAIYGKGGIGKSTIAANISAALADAGFSVLHIGCDPKRDSTRALLGDLQQVTVTEYLRGGAGGRYAPGDLIEVGYKGVACIEAGGPEPGIGCAGRGILSTFEVLDQFENDMSRFAYVLYDVLGDVVCGGFAVPLRHGYADTVLIVTSGEYLSLYAANNILRGIRNFDGDRKRIGGIIYNSRGGAEEDEQVGRFAKAVHLPVLVKIPRSELFHKAERVPGTLIGEYPDSEEAALFRGLAAHLTGDGGFPRYRARPLEAPELEALISGRNVKTPPPRRAPAPPPGSRGFIEEPLRPGPGSGHPPYPGREPLFGCAFSGAVVALSQIRDVAVVAHGPSNCAHIVSQLLTSSYNRDIQKNPGRRPMPSVIPTRMDEHAVVFGGEEALAASVQNAALAGYRTVFIVSTCVPGLTGDDIAGCARDLSAKYSIRAIAVPVDGVGEGDFSAGTTAGYRAASSLIAPGVRGRPRSVIIAGEKTLANNTSANFDEIAAYLSALDIRVVCRFLANTSVGEVESAGEADLILPASSDVQTRAQAEILSAKTRAEIFPLPFPHTFRACEDWVRGLAERYGARKEAEALIRRHRVIYRGEIDRIGRAVAGKKVIISSSGPDISWVLDILTECGMEVPRVGLFGSPYPQAPHDPPTGVSVTTGYSPDRLYADIADIRPDLVLTTIWPDPKKAKVRWGVIPFCPNAGFFGSLSSMRQWAGILAGPVSEGWRDDL
ncbi:MULTISPECIES: nitrogenase component 1 [unclassified Methanoculleus]|jgi:nitrogenase iron protein|uniref:nitrogenase component 1 n=1 Tax=unclassified Methanoculleus TaxID=2619537 RepID=UPI0025F95C8C|nr:nitrogenase component 1 [Methanoculleus sp. UBA377]